MSIQQIDFKDKKALVRVDFNVPLDSEYKIKDTMRIREVLPTLKYILERGGALILASHYGRPKRNLLPDGSVNKERFTLKHIVPGIEELLGKPVIFAQDCGGEDSVQKAGNLRSGEVLLLENTRFHKEEEAGDKDFAGRLAALADVFVNDAFGTAHRNHASNAVVAGFFPCDRKCFGLLMERELTEAKKLTENPRRPFTAILGGAKVSDKIQLIENFFDLADQFIVGGGMAHTFTAAMGGSTGNSLVEKEHIALAGRILDKAEMKGIKFMLPVDAVCGDSFSPQARINTVDSHEIPEGWMGLDIGPFSISQFETIVLGSRTIFWNGPMGVSEFPPFALGTKAIAGFIAKATIEHGAYSLVGGGDSAAAINQMGLAEQVSYVSTGGGAMLTLLEGRPLPGVSSILEG